MKNATKIEAPTAIYESLIEKLKITSRLEDSGQTRTFIAIDPDSSVPIDFPSSPRLAWRFQRLVGNILREFNYNQKSKDVRDVERVLHNFIYEVFQNTIEHGRYSKEGKLIPGLRYLRIRTYIDINIDRLRRRAQGFSELERFLTSHIGHKHPTLRFMELSVSDGGQGIVSHYLNSDSRLAENNSDREALLCQLVSGTKSSKNKLSGVGLGLPNAMDALSKLKAFISLRTEEFWMYRDFINQKEIEYSNKILPVSTARPVNNLRGTQFNVLICISN